MKVDGNQLVPNIEFAEDSVGAFGIPLRLEIAARLLAGKMANRDHIDGVDVMVVCRGLLAIADCLIDAHNESVEGE